MTKYIVSVEKQARITGGILVWAETPEQAQIIIDNRMKNKEKPLQTDDGDIEWGDYEYTDGTFQTTGDVEEW